MIFVVNLILKMGLPVFMADNEGFLNWLTMLNPKFQLKHRKSLSSLLKQIADASFNKLKTELKAALMNGSKLVLAVDVWTGRNRTKYLGVIGYWICKWQLKDGLLALIPYDLAKDGRLTGALARQKLHICLQTQCRGLVLLRTKMWVLSPVTAVATWLSALNYVCRKMQ